MSSGAAPNRTVTDVPVHTASDGKDDLDERDIGFNQFPEGGTAAWCMIVGGMLAQFCCLGYMTSFGVYQEYYTLNYLKNESTSSISWIGSVSTCMMYAIGPVVGILYDRGYFYHPLIGGSALQSFCLFMLSLAQPGKYYQIFFAHGIGLGLAQGVVHTPTIAVVSHYFYRRRTLAMSLVASGSSLGAVIHPIMLNYLFNRGIGFTNGVRISAILVSVLLTLSCLLIRTRSEPPKRAATYLSIVRDIIHDVPFDLMGAGFLFFHIGFCFPHFYLQLDSVQHGNSETFSFYSLVLLNGGNLIGRLSAGFIAPRIGIGRTTVISTTACATLIFGMIGLGSVVSVIVMGTVYGYFAGISTFPNSDSFYTSCCTLILIHRMISTRMGIGITLAGIGALVGGPISGILLTSQYRWWRPALFNGLVALFGCVFLALMEVVRTRRGEASEKEVKA